MNRRLPIVSTIVVLAAVATMVALGVWQLQRGAVKDAMIARYSAAQSLSSAVPWPRSAEAREKALYRHSSVHCDRVLSTTAKSGRSFTGQTGWAHVARCTIDGGGEAEIVLGWTNNPETVSWGGGEALGFVAPGGPDGARLVAQPPLAGLAASARPDPGDLPNNHLAYAFQWFFFAATALVIYVLAVRRRGNN
jgi:surfeit locus 1 family protein